MQETYEAILRGDHLEWSGEDRPALSSHDRPVAVRVTILGEAAPAGNGRLMAEALERLADMQALPNLPDPAAWEREARQERPLPDREG
ncbi:MAG: hypothetical protein H0V83_08240 [Rubrobacter sp.]|nr:hypothetical protein [Rubrobacter sp.]